MKRELTWQVVIPPSKNAVSANIKHIVDTSIRHQISGQSTPMEKG